MIQLQTAAIKKILSSSIQSIPSQNLNKPKCEDIESELKNTLKKSTGQEIQFQEYQLTEEDGQTEKQVDVQKQRGDITNDESIVIDVPLNIQNNEKQPLPNGRNLFNFYRSNDDIPTTPSTTTTTTNYNYAESQNIILIPCIKQIGNRRFDQDVTQEEQEIGTIHSHSDEIEHATESVQNQNSYVLQKVYSPSGYFLYYMYRLQNTNPYPYSGEQLPAPSSTTSTTLPTTTMTTTSTPPPAAAAAAVQEPVYAEQLKFVIQMPYNEPQQVYPQNVQFDQYAYYPPDMQPGYVNAAQPYRPTYHMIRTLVIPNEYLSNYSANDQQSLNTENSNQKK